MQVHVQTNAYSSADEHHLHGVASITGAKDHVLPYPQPLGQGHIAEEGGKG